MPVATPQRTDFDSTAPQDVRGRERDRLDSAHPPGWHNPKPADRYSLIVVGGGAAGLVAAHAAAALATIDAFESLDAASVGNSSVARHYGLRLNHSR